VHKQLRIDIDDSAKTYLEEHGAKAVTVDIEMFGGCIVITETDVKLGPPHNPHHFEKYEVDGYDVYVFRTVQFEQNRLHIYKKKGLLAKKGLEAGKLKQL
jgi:hypothetical protein